jgi:hypothetical protein
VGLRAGRSWPIAHHGCANHASIQDAALQAGTWPGLRCVEPWTHAGPEPAGWPGHRARGDGDAIHARRRRTMLVLQLPEPRCHVSAMVPDVIYYSIYLWHQGTLQAGRGRKSTELIAGLVVPRIHWRSEPALYIHRSNSRF